MAAAGAKSVLVYGGKGALGNIIVQHFKKSGWWVGSIDMKANEDANANVIITNTESLPLQEQEIVAGVKNLGFGQSKLDAILCVAGGWSGGNASAADFMQSVDTVLKQSVWSSVIAARLASLFLKDGGLLTLTGANAALEPTPGMIGYGMAKAGVHHLIKSLGAPDSGLPTGATAVAILPAMLDTPMNRKWMPKADTSTWTPLEFVSDLLFRWAEKNERPSSGSLVTLLTTNGATAVSQQ